jgi:PEP-CTERM motif
VSNYKNLLIVIFTIAHMFSGSVKAEQNIITFDFTGSVLYSDSSLNAPIDSLVSGSFSYDLNAPTQIAVNSPPFTHSYYNYTSPSALTLIFSGHNISFDDLQYDLFDNQNGNVEDQFNLSAHSDKINGIDYGTFVLALASSSGVGNRNALTSSQPPQTLDLSLFNNTNDFTYGVLVKNNTYTLQFSILSLAPVPEPESYALLLAGLGVIGLMVHQKNYS